MKRAGRQVCRQSPGLPAPLDFSRTDTILKFDWAGCLYSSTNRGRLWEGPFRLPMFDMHSWQLRTDYIVENSSTVIALWSGSKQRYQREENGGMVYEVRTEDGGLTWTAALATATLSKSEVTYTLGGTTNTWGRTWSAADFSNTNFRVRVVDVASNTSRDFSLDYLAVNVTYQP